MAEPFPLSACKTMTAFDLEYLLKSGDYLMEEKVDGWRMQFDVTPDSVQGWTRTNHDSTGKMPAVEKDLLWMTRNVHSFRLDGEAVYIDENGVPDYNFTARCLGSGRDVCIDKQRDRGALTYMIFDILQMDGHDVRGQPLGARKQLMARFLRDGANTHIIHGVEPSFEQHAKNFDEFLEGSVLKQISSAYAGKRHKSWLKLKEQETLDVKIIGYKPGQGKFEGLIGAIQFQAEDGTVGFCSGMDDETRIWISDRKSALMGRIFEVKHYGRLVDGFRHPQYVRFRGDKQ